ncbi:energy transducer TonB [Hephaestia sp. GCM10023244]|uniref:energy transducer TonB n=1 Tax=unclassified Hephaestia TaxID=2631281 RepID=UPI00207771B8|nr:energy transducer TonB [Hephaestia sp. MAHUQ-44]
MTATALLFAALWIGLAVHQRVADDAALHVFDVLPPPIPAPAPVERSAQPSGDAAPAHRLARPVVVAAPTPIVRVTVPPVVAAPVVAISMDRAAGAADAGMGTGASGAGIGLGAGGSGTGTGGGAIVRARHVSGTITNKDYPKSARKAGHGGIVTVTLTIAADGRVSDCLVARSSGVASLDETTCRLARMRFRYTPARDAAGRAVPDLAGWQQRWWFAGR